MGAIRERLEAEFTALEAANVHAILDSTAAAPKVVKKIDVAFGKLEDLELTLDVFDGKLSAMRDDIATIEARNNSLETQTRSLERLQRAVEDLLASLTVRRQLPSLSVILFAPISSSFLTAEVLPLLHSALADCRVRVGGTRRASERMPQLGWSLAWPLCQAQPARTTPERHSP